MIVLAALSAAVLLFEALRFDIFIRPALENPYFAILYIGLPLCLLAGSLILLFLPVHAQSNALVSVISLFLAAYMAEAVLTVARSRSGSRIYDLRTANNAAAAARRGIPFDRRSAFEVIKQSKDSGSRSYPLMARQKFNREGAPVQALAGIPDAQTVVCNECGTYMVYKSDEHGFNNPAGLYSQAPVQIVIVGDSYAQGDCLAQDKSSAAFLRETYPLTLTLGIGGMGPLMELAVLKEYGEPLKPRAVVLFYFEGNDLSGLSEESKDPLLMSYLTDTEFSQGLWAKKELLSSVLSRLAESAIAAEEVKINQRACRSGLKDFLTFHNLRSLITMRTDAINNDRKRHIASSGESLQLFKDVLVRAKDLTASWGGKFYVVYIPEWQRFARGRGNQYRRQVLEYAGHAGIPVIDLFEEFNAAGDPLRFYPFRLNNHFNEDGYREIAALIKKALEKDNVFDPSGN